MPENQKPNPTIDRNMIGPVGRHNARRYALQAMYQWQLTGTSVDDIEAEFLHFHIDKKLDLAYFKELIRGIIKYQPEIDQEISQFLGRSLQEIDQVELAVLRIAVYELMHRVDVPYRVIINEALELTKQFGSVEGYKFVNGVLDKIAKKNRQNEIR